MKKPDKIFDAFTGVEFQPRVGNHYEHNDGVPVAPPLNMPRLSLRQRVERLLSGGTQPDSGWDYGDEDALGLDDDADEPLTQAERAYVAAGEAIEARERALRDPAPTPPEEPKTPPEAPKPPEPGVASPPAGTPPD